MKQSLKLLAFALLAFGMMACGEKKLTEEDLKKAETTLYADDMTANTEAIPAVMKQFCEFVEQNPDAPTAPEWLFKAFDLSVRQKNLEKSEELCNKLVENYPDFDKTPAAMFMMASIVYGDQFNDLDKARSMYESIISNYPETNWALDAKQMRDHYLGMTDEQIMNVIQKAQEKEAEEVVE